MVQGVRNLTAKVKLTHDEVEKFFCGLPLSRGYEFYQSTSILFVRGDCLLLSIDKSLPKLLKFLVNRAFASVDFESGDFFLDQVFWFSSPK